MRAAALAALLGLAACHPALPPAAPSLPMRSVQAHLVEGKARGKLVLGWLTEAQATRWERHQILAQDLVDLAARMQVAGEVELDATPRSFRASAPADARLLAVLDVGGHFWGALFGDGGLLGLATPGTDDVTLRAGPEHGAGPACDGPRMQAIVVEDAALAGALHGETARRFCAWLPKSYADHPGRRYPVAYLLPGFGSRDMAYLLGADSLGAAADRLADELGREIILVGVDTRTRTGSTYLVDSPITGAFERFLGGKALPAIDAALRTIPRREARALIGHSTGGFNAVSFGLRHGELFSVIGASSPDGLDLGSWLTDERGAMRPWLLAWMRLDAAVGPPGQLWSYGADWSPGADGVPRWPFDLRTGRRTAALARWLAQAPSAIVDRADVRATLATRYTDRVFIAVGAKDEFGLEPPARAFAARLTALGLRPTFVVDADAGHFERSRDRLARALRYALERLMPAVD